MTGRPTFGEFAATATRHLRDLQLRGTGLGDPQSAADAVAEVRAAVHALTCYANDVCATLNSADATDEQSLRSWRRAAVTAQQALAAAEASWAEPAALDGTATSQLPVGLPASGLGAAARYMTLGRDLLHTHLTFRPSREQSDWASVVTSVPVACALLELVGGWARQVAPYAGHFSTVGGVAPADRQMLNTACRGLWIATWAVGTAQERHPLRNDELHMLGTVPVAGQPPASQPSPRAIVPELCDGLIKTAERLRAASRRAVLEATWSQALTRESFRQTAGCCAITASNLRIMLQSLAAHHGHPCAPVSSSLAEAAEAADRARAAWLHVAEGWDSISTDTRGSLNPVATEATALALWTGRLAYASPSWTPALGPQHTARPSAELAGDHNHLRHVVDATHHVGHTLAVVADSERDQARTASMHGRLIVPTRSLPESFNIPYRFAPAPGIRTTPLLASYDQALQASEGAVGALRQIATEIRAVNMSPAVNSTAVRVGTASAAEPARVTSEPHPLGSAQASGLHAASAPAPSAQAPQQVPAGPVERILLDLDVTSRADLEQAACLDAAADRLILRAANTARPSERSLDPARSAGTAELITRLLVASGDTLPSALQPGASGAVSARRRDLTEQPHRTSIRPRARQAEPEAGG